MNTSLSPRDSRRFEIALALLAAAEQAVQNHQSADAFLAQAFRESRQFGSKDRKFYSAVIFAWFRWKGLFPSDLPKEQAVALTYGLDDNPPDSALSAYAPSADASPASSPAPKTVAEKIETLRRLHPTLSTLYPNAIIPSWVPALIEPSLSMKADSLLEAAQTRPPTWLRVPHASTDALIDPLRAILPDVARHPACPAALSTRARFNLTDIHRTVNPHLEIQDLASQAVGLLCRPRAGQRWWDVCAGSGGKALHLTDLMSGRGTVSATDIRSASLRNLQQRADRSGIHCIHTAHVDTVLSSDKSFDGVLVDAPCSGIGTWGRNPDARWRLAESDIPSIAETQKKLLETTHTHVRPGGMLVYSVCTLTQIETTQIIRTFLSAHPEFALYPFVHPLRQESSNGTCFILPWQDACNGMFIACLKKNA